MVRLLGAKVIANCPPKVTDERFEETVPLIDPLIPDLLTRIVPPALETATAPLASEKPMPLTVRLSWWDVGSSAKENPPERFCPRTISVSVCPVGLVAVRPPPLPNETLIGPLNEKPLAALPAERNPLNDPVTAPAVLMLNVPEPPAWPGADGPMVTSPPPNDAERFVALRCRPVLSLVNVKFPETV